MYMWRKLRLKAYLTYYNEGTKKSPEKILILQNKTQLKQKIVFTSLDTSFMSNH